MSLRFMSERPEPNAPGLRDCTWACGVMAANAMGAPLPLGFTVAEREALERANGNPPEHGGDGADLDAALAERYGVALDRVPDTGAALRGPDGTAVVLAANWHLVPERLGRWDPAFWARDPALHRVVFAPSGDGQTGLLLDPLALPGWKGEQVRAADLGPAALAASEQRVFAIKPDAPKWQLLVEPSKTVQVAALEPSGRLGPWSPVHMPDRDTSRSCEAPQRLVSHAGVPCTVALVTQGVMKGSYAHLGPGVKAVKAGG